ncbi:MAG: hypothetical protein JSS23_12385 [Proteobacteria bacterium]|nr:hypothetical protein [Pseudomonadota bacterium]
MSTANPADGMTDAERIERIEQLQQETKLKLDQLALEERIQGRSMEISILRAELEKRILKLRSGNLESPSI